MIKVKRIIDILELAIFSAYIKGEQPVSILITAPVEAGKTEIVLQFAQNKGCVALTDATAYGIMRDYGQLIVNRKVRHLIVPDLVKPMSRGKDTVHSLIAFLNSLVEEGVIRISTYAERIAAPTQTSGPEVQPRPVKCGLIATLAKDILLDGRHHWSRMGFMSRMIPVSYEYAISTQIDIQKSIAKREYLADEPIILELPDEDMEVRLEPPQSDDLILLTASLVAAMAASKNPEKIYGFRLQKQLQRLAMANALKNKRDIVIEEDVDCIRLLSGCINLQYYPI
jgi:hypothetical protein